MALYDVVILENNKRTVGKYPACDETTISEVIENMVKDLDISDGSRAYVTVPWFDEASNEIRNVAYMFEVIGCGSSRRADNQRAYEL